MRVRAWVRGRRGVQESLAVEARDGGEGDGSGERVTERAGSGWHHDGRKLGSTRAGEETLEPMHVVLETLGPQEGVARQQLCKVAGSVREDQSDDGQVD